MKTLHTTRLRHLLATVFAVAMVALLLSCGRHKTPERQTRPFPSLQIPALIAGDNEAEFFYTLEHFWDGLTDTTQLYVCDSIHVGGVEADEVRQHFQTYATYLLMCDLPQSQESIRRMYDLAVRCHSVDTLSNIFETLISLADTYLYDPNSPLRDEDVYGALADRLSAYEGFSEEERDRYAYYHRMAALNERGTVAADFAFRDARGRERNLHSISADYILLFFSNPGCHACKEIIETLSDQLNVDALIAAGKLAVVNIYIDEDRQGWYDYMPIYPTNWYNGYDPYLLIRGETLYNVRAIPSLYLLDRDFRVLLKDAPNEVIYNELAYLSQNGRL
ncbi:MAG: DUF5106 domain-containing protein [Bacteroidales bacterium]|nr:DUF5106 domain-containing protein [Bacteroidales bacterium]